MRLGKSESQVRRDSAELRKAGLIRVERPNKTENNRYFFLWDTAFDRADVHGHDHADMHAPIKEKQRVVANTDARVKGGAEGFLEFKAAYPEQKREIAVDSACRAYLSVIDGIAGEHERLMAGLARYIASAEWRQRLRQKPDGRTIPTMAMFITDRRYLDHPPPEDELDDGYRPASEFQAGRGIRERGNLMSMRATNNVVEFRNREERLERVNLMLAREDSDWLDQFAAEIRERHGVRISRSEIARTALAMLRELHTLAPTCPERFAPLSVCRSGEQLQAIGVLAVRWATMRVQGRSYTPRKFLTLNPIRRFSAATHILKTDQNGELFAIKGKNQDFRTPTATNRSGKSRW